MDNLITEHIGYRLQHFAPLLARNLDQSLQERLGIGLSEYKILLIVEENTKIQQRNVANRLGQTEASISRQLRLLIKKGLLISRIDNKDHRSHITQLTVSGLRLIEAAHQVFMSENDEIFNQLNTKQQQQFQEILSILDSSVIK